MNILIIGGNGFIGRHIAAKCVADGHRAILGVRHADQPSQNVDYVECDMKADTDAATWFSRLNNIDCVINTVGLLHAGAAELQAVHVDAPAALAAACSALKKPFLHVSLLGLRHAADTDYFQSKRRGEDAVRAAHSGAIIVRPSLVFGRDSPATQWLLLQSYLPVLCLPRETKNIAPIHVDDLAALCLSLVSTVRALGCDVDCVGAEECTIVSYVQALRQARGRTRARVIHIPNRWMRVGMECAAFCGARTMTPEALDLMEHAHTGDKRAFTRWMRRQPATIAEFQAVVH